MRTALICHDGATLDDLLVHWLSSFSDLAGVVILNETKQRKWRRVQAEVKRVGLLRFFDVMAFRLYYSCFRSKKDERWLRGEVARRKMQFQPPPRSIEFLRTHSPNSAACHEFITRLKPDLVIARCKTLLMERIFSIPTVGTFVIHPGICPEYRNAHGCFWALAKQDFNNVGATLLKIDCGIDSGPIFEYYHYDRPSIDDSHIMIQHRLLMENLDHIKNKLIEIENGQAIPIATQGRGSAVWGQPWMTAHRQFTRSLRRMSR
jgi:hypothetical protein